MIGLKALILVHKEVNKKTDEGCSIRTQGRSRFDINNYMFPHSYEGNWEGKGDSLH